VATVVRSVLQRNLSTPDATVRNYHARTNNQIGFFLPVSEPPQHLGWVTSCSACGFQEAVKSQKSPLTCWSSMGSKYLSHLEKRSERPSHLGVPLNCHAVSAADGIGQSMKTVISKICIGENKKKIPNLSHLQTFHLEKGLPPPPKLLLPN